MKIWNHISASAAALAATIAIAGCGGGSSKSASAAATTTGTTATTPTSSTTTSTAAKPPSKTATQSTTPAKTTSTSTTPAKTSAKATPHAKPEPQFGKIKLTSTAFKAGGPIPVKYTCDGANISPPLQWQHVPNGAAELFVLALDLSGSASDAIQWAVAIPPNATGIPEGHLPPGAVAGLNSEGKVGWGGICGASGTLHRVGFLFYAVKHKLGVKQGFKTQEVRGGLKGATLGTGLTLATYQRP